MTQHIPAWVDGQFVPVDKLDAHRRGLRHLAISVFLMDGDRTLIQRRAMGKYHSAGLWANAVCTHPHWGEPTPVAAARRLREELGVTGLTLIPRDRVEYRADVGPGLIEHELVSLYTANFDASLPLDPNPAEVLEVRWIALAQLRAEIEAAPTAFTAWLRIYLADHSGQIFGAAA